MKTVKAFEAHVQKAPPVVMIGICLGVSTIGVIILFHSSILLVESLSLFTFFTALALTKNYANPACTVRMNEAGLEIDVRESSLLFPRTIFHSAWRDLRRVNSRYTAGNKRVYAVEFSRPSITLYLNSLEGEAEEDAEFGNLLMSYIEKFNHANPARKINAEGTDEKKWVTALRHLQMVFIIIGLWMVWPFAAIVAALLLLVIYYEGRKAREAK